MHYIKSRIPRIKRKHLYHPLRISFWFCVGAFLALFFISSFAFLIFQKNYKELVYPGVMVNGIDFSKKTKGEVRDYFNQKNFEIKNTTFVFTTDKKIATVSAEQIDFGYNEDLLSSQAYEIGRSKNILSNLSLILQAYITGINLPASYAFSERELKEKLETLAKEIEKEPIDALFKFENGRVTAFRQSANGSEIDQEKLIKDIKSKTLTVISSKGDKVIIIPVPIKVLKPNVTTDKANNLGIKELIGEGHSLFYHSIPGRVHNINLASSRFQGVLIAPGEVFSFNKILGDVSSFTGYEQAYIIQDGKTVLGDGGGVCQVSTTLFRAVLNAGLPIAERNQHSYRVGYYEQDSPPGLDATVYSPTVDLKFKNDTGKHILIQRVIDLNNLSLSFYLYGTKDGRQVIINKPVITSQSPAPPAEYQDDPTLLKGQTKQIDFAAPGAKVYFTREVIKNGKVVISDNFYSNYRPWKAVFLVGTKEN